MWVMESFAWLRMHFVAYCSRALVICLSSCSCTLVSILFAGAIVCSSSCSCTVVNDYEFKRKYSASDNARDGNVRLVYFAYVLSHIFRKRAGSRVSNRCSEV